MKPRAVVLTASIDNDDDIRRWVTSVQRAASKVQESIDKLSAELRDAPHIAITIHQHPEPTAQQVSEGDDAA